jgi:DNA-binding winged helix-turn-helix (wHTH) protein
MNDRRNSQPKDVLFFGPFSLFAAERLLKKADESIPIGGRALDILIALAERAGEVVTHRELISTVWPGATVEDANLRAHIAALRKALGDGRDGARYVSNVTGRAVHTARKISSAEADDLPSDPICFVATDNDKKL